MELPQARAVIGSTYSPSNAPCTPLCFTRFWARISFIITIFLNSAGACVGWNCVALFCLLQTKADKGRKTMAKAVMRAEARAIRKELHGGASVRDVARRFGRSPTTVALVRVDARTYKHPVSARIRARLKPGMTARQLWVALGRKIPLKQIYNVISFRKVSRANTKTKKKLPNKGINEKQLRALCAFAAKW